jgi:uncharacterized protein
MVYTLNSDFEWDSTKNKRNFHKHGIWFEDATSVFLDTHHVIKYDEVHSEHEDRFQLIARNQIGLLLIVFIERENNKIRIISAQRAHQKEREIYEEKNRI